MNGMWQDNNKIDGTQTLPFIPNFTNYSAGLYWVEKLSTKKWDWDFGIRYDFRYARVAGFDFRNKLYRSEFSFNNVSGTLGGTYKINQNSSFTTNLGSTWRPPNVAELYSLGTHQSAAAIEYGLLLDESTNEVLDIEDVNFKTEQALKWVNTYRIQKGKWNMDLSGYINYIFNYIYLNPRGITQNTRGVFPYFRYTQTNASFVGSDLSVQYSLSNSLAIGSKVSLLRATDQTRNDYLIFIPSNRYEVSLRYEKIKWEAGVIFIPKSEQNMLPLNIGLPV
jgi:iron complex outermembrane recepter protein